jgi:cell division protease FtsH
MAKATKTAQTPKRKKSTTIPTLHARLRKHFGTDPSKLPVVEQQFQQYDRANLHISINELLTGCKPTLIGIVLRNHYDILSLAKLSHPTIAKGYEEGPVEYIDVQLADDQKLACVKQGLYTFQENDQPLAMLIAFLERFHSDSIRVEVMAIDRETAERFARKLAKSVRHGSAFRGKVLSVEQDCHGHISVRYHKLPPIPRSSLILPEELLCRIERQAIGLSKNAARLKASGRHLKRGILMHGKPGTGKTLSAMYLAAQMPGRTVMVLTGNAIRSIETACGLARLLEPATIILEDVDLIGTERQHQTVGANALLFELLNQMDGLGEDADVLFILTTNRPDYLEPALASRPGRIDLAIEVPLPDETCRKLLFELYGKGLKVELTEPETWVRRTKGVSAAFIRELLRKAAVLAAEDDESSNGRELTILDRHMEEAAAELLVAGGMLTKTLLGVDRNGSE